MNYKKEVRRFKTGATRDNNEDKLDFEGFLSPIVMLEFGKYMHKHRKLPDGSYRDSDNWQKGFGSGKEHYDVVMQSMFRHFHDLWMEHRGFKSREGVINALMGILFNVQSYAHQYILDNKDYQNSEHREKADS